MFIHVQLKCSTFVCKMYFLKIKVESLAIRLYKETLTIIPKTFLIPIHRVIFLMEKKKD